MRLLVSEVPLYLLLGHNPIKTCSVFRGSSSLLPSSLELSDTQVYEPQIRALLASHFWGCIAWIDLDGDAFVDGDDEEHSVLAHLPRRPQFKNNYFAEM